MGQIKMFTLSVYIVNVARNICAWQHKLLATFSA